MHGRILTKLVRITQYKVDMTLIHFQGHSSKVKVRQQELWKCCEFDSYWTAERLNGFWSKLT